ncbi:SMBT1-like protein [Mya arenaria]|uniref:SMBT1-like protein n=1 Tax=Mya arenaria TaxID=6604 RepID=A0ABY7FXX6_MYAAR|nr:SMBT1-like protein [Mya arenaria]
MTTQLIMVDAHELQCLPRVYHASLQGAHRPWCRHPFHHVLPIEHPLSSTKMNPNSSTPRDEKQPTLLPKKVQLSPVQSQVPILQPIQPMPAMQPNRPGPFLMQQPVLMNQPTVSGQTFFSQRPRMAAQISNPPQAIQLANQGPFVQYSAPHQPLQIGHQPMPIAMSMANQTISVANQSQHFQLAPFPRQTVTPVFSMNNAPQVYSVGNLQVSSYQSLSPSIQMRNPLQGIQLRSFAQPLPQSPSKTPPPPQPAIPKSPGHSSGQLLIAPKVNPLPKAAPKVNIPPKVNLPRAPTSQLQPIQVLGNKVAIPRHGLAQCTTTQYPIFQQKLQKETDAATEESMDITSEKAETNEEIIDEVYAVLNQVFGNISEQESGPADKEKDIIEDGELQNSDDKPDEIEMDGKDGKDEQLELDSDVKHVKRDFVKFPGKVYSKRKVVESYCDYESPQNVENFHELVLKLRQKKKADVEVETATRDASAIEKDVASKSEEDEPQFIWEEYLRQVGAEAVPSSAFKHVEHSLESGFVKGMKLEVKVKSNSNSSSSSDNETDSYWVATVMMTCGPLLRLRYDGYKEEGAGEFWCDLATTEVHPIGWCAANQQNLQPPEEIRDSVEDWHEYLKEILENVGGRLYLRLEGTNLASKHFWMFYLDMRLHPLGWATENGCTYKPPADVRDEKTDEEWTEILQTAMSESENDLTPAGVFKDQLEPKTHQFQPGMRLEALVPGANYISPATVTKVINDKYFLIEIDDIRPPGERESDGPMETLCGESICLDVGTDDHEYERGMKLEAVNPTNPNQICAATITKIVDPLLWVHLDHQRTWCPRIYINHKCFSGPHLSKGRIADIPCSVGPGPMDLVLKQVLNYSYGSKKRKPAALLASKQAVKNSISKLLKKGRKKKTFLLTRKKGSRHERGPVGLSGPYVMYPHVQRLRPRPDSLKLDSNPLYWSVDRLVQFIKSTDCSHFARIIKEQCSPRRESSSSEQCSPSQCSPSE